MFAWQATVQDEDGNIVPLPVVTVYQSDGSTLADIYDETGAPLSNPLTGTLEGFVQFWANPGKYRIIGTNGGVTSEWFVDGGGLDSAAIPIASHSVAETVNVNPDIDVLRVMAGGRMLEYVRDPSGTALQTADGAWWSPAGDVTPQHWGAVADGVVDDTAAMQAAVDWFRVRGRAGRLFLPSAKYRLTSSVYITTDGTREGDPVAITIEGEAQGSLTSHNPGTEIVYSGTGYALHFGRGTGNSRGPVILRNFSLNGEGVGYGGIYLKRAANYYVRGPGSPSGFYNLRIVRFSIGAYLFKCYGLSVDTCTFLENSEWGLCMDNANHLVVCNSKINNNNRGLRIFYNSGTSGDGESDVGGASAAGIISGCAFELNAYEGISIERQQSLIIQGCYIEGNSSQTNGPQIIIGGANGLVSDRVSKSVVITGNRLQVGDGLGGTSGIGVDLVYADDCHIHGNQFMAHAVASVRSKDTVGGLNSAYGNRHEGPNRFSGEPAYLLTGPGSGTVRTLSDRVESNAVSIQIPEARFFVRAGDRVHVEWDLPFSTSSSSHGIGIGIGGNASVSDIKACVSIPTSTTGIYSNTLTAFLNSVVSTTSSSSMKTATIRADMTVTSPGYIYPIFRTSSAGNPVTVHSGAYGRIVIF